MKRQAFTLGIGLLAGCGLAIGLHRVPARPGTVVAATTVPEPAATAQPTGGPTTDKNASALAPGIAELGQQLTAFLAMPNPSNTWSEIDDCLTAWAEIDPWTALEFVRTAPRFPQRLNALAIPLAKIAASDPNKATDWLLGHLSLPDRNELRAQLVARIAEDHPHEATVLALADPAALSSSFVEYALGQLAASAPADALAVLDTLPPQEREQAAGAIASNWAKHDPDAAIRWCQSLGDRDYSSNATRSALGELAGDTPGAAVAALARLRPPVNVTVDVLRQIATADAGLALGALASLPADQQAAATKAIATAAFDSAPDKLLALLHANVPAADIAPALRTAWIDWRYSDRTAAEAWAARTTDPTARNVIAQIELENLTTADPDLFLSSIDSIPAAQLETEAIQTALGSTRPATAANWIAGHPTLVPPEVVAQTAANYFQADRQAATLWATNLPAGESRDRALSSVASSWGQAGDSTAADTALAAIANPQLQTASRFRVFNVLHGNNSEVALKWLAAQPLSAEVRASWEAIGSAAADPAPATATSHDCD